MEMQEFVEAFNEKRLEKRLYWKLMREKFVSLLEIQSVLQKNSLCERIEISKDQIVLTFQGIRFLFDFGQTICRAEVVLMTNCNPEQEDFDFLGELLSDDDVVFDVGANVGVFSLSLLKMRPRLKKIYAFEPILPTFRRMEQNLDLNSALVQNKISAVNVGLSDKAGTFVFYLPGTDEAASLRPVTDPFYLQESVQGKWTGESGMEKMQCRVDTLDSFVTQHNIHEMRLLKIDTEGNEKGVLAGGTNAIKKWSPIVYSELLRKHAARFDYHPNDVIALMHDLGYRCFTFHEHVFEEMKEMTNETEETNFFFLHSEKHAAIIRHYGGGRRKD